MKFIFLLECPRLVQYHQQLAQCVNAYCKNYYLLTNEENMIILMTNENPRICRAMGKIIYDAFEFRQKRYGENDQDINCLSD